MRNSPGWGIVCAVCLTFPFARALAQETSNKPTVVQAGHFFHKDETGQCQEVKVVVELSQPEVVVRPGSTTSTSEPRERCCLFRRFHRGERATVGSFIFTPAVLPLNQGAAPSPSTQGAANVDLAGLRNLHEMQERLATLDAQQAAQEAVRQQTQGALNRLTQSLQSFGSRQGLSGASGTGVSGAGTDTVTNQLKILDKRLTKLEELVLLHQEVLRNLGPKPKPEQIPEPKPEQIPAPKPAKPPEPKPEEKKPEPKPEEKKTAGTGDTSGKPSAGAPELLHFPTSVK
jgi:hypothetical protein